MNKCNVYDMYEVNPSGGVPICLCGNCTLTYHYKNGTKFSGTFEEVFGRRIKEIKDEQQELGRSRV